MNRPAAPAAVATELQAVLELIALQPESGIATPSTRVNGLRRFLLARISYVLYYRVAPRKRIVEVIAFWHASRGTRPLS
jgi:plasmid stabilization system protein ParE